MTVTRVTVLMVFLWTVRTLSHAAEELVIPLYTLNYQINISGLKVQLTRSLTKDKEFYNLRQTGKSFLIDMTEKSQFSLNGKQILGHQFQYELTGLRNERREVQFVKETGKIRSLRDQIWTEHIWSPEVLDRLSLQEQLRINLMTSVTLPESVSLKVLDGAKVKTKDFELIGTDTMDTKVGALRAAHYRRVHRIGSDRSSEIWLAVDYDFVIVRTEHIDRKSKTTLVLVSGVVAGHTFIGT